MDTLLHPSTLGSWAACPLRAWHDLDHADERSDAQTIASWVGSAAHFEALGFGVFPDPAGWMLYDSVTPDIKTARVQIARIATALYRVLDMRGLSIVARERAVQDEQIKGTLDMVLERDIGGSGVIADLKTGKQVPAGAWLQLGSYFRAYGSEHPGEAGQVAVIHVPRVPLTVDQPAGYVARDGLMCAELTARFQDHVEHLLQTRTLATAPPNPGVHCHGCPVACAVGPVEKGTD